MIDFENKYIEKQIFKGYYGIKELLEGITDKDFSGHNLLMKQIGLEKIETADDAQNYLDFTFDTLRMEPELFMNKWEVNFWIARDEMLKAIAFKYHEFNEKEKENYILGIVNNIS